MFTIGTYFIGIVNYGYWMYELSRLESIASFLNDIIVVTISLYVIIPLILAWTGSEVSKEVRLIIFNFFAQRMYWIFYLFHFYITGKADWCHHS